MATTKTLAQLRTAARQRADMENSTFVSDTELTDYVNQSYFELYDLLVQKFGDDYFVATPHTATTTSSETYDLPTDLYKLLGVDIGSTGNFIALKPFTFSERNLRSGVAVRQNLRYRLRGSSLWLTPAPAAGQTLRLWYVPRLTPLSADADTADGVSGWTEYLICDAAIKCLQKEESDVSVLMAQKMALIKRIEAAAENRDAGSPAVVSDSQNMGLTLGYFTDPFGDL